MYLNCLLTLVCFSMTFCSQYYLLETEDKKDGITSTTPNSNKAKFRRSSVITTGKVNCGNHQAATCSKCPWDLNTRQNYGKYWCNGDCSWKAGICSSKQKGEVNCGNHVASTCRRCPWDFTTRKYYYGKKWCNGDCAWKADSCSAKTKACKCGIEHRIIKKKRIVGGKEVDKKNKYPWIVALMSTADDRHFCGGTLVASKYVISAAHCMWLDWAQTQPLTKTDFQVRLGDHDLTSQGEGGLAEMTIKVVKYSNHEDFNKRTFEHDITIIELAKAVDLTTYTPACLAKTSDTNFVGKLALVYGWGRTSSGGALSHDKLLEVMVPVVGKATCRAGMAPLTVTDDMICAGGLPGKDACGGDSGGPLTYKRGEQHILIGDTSWGTGCAREGKYGVYGRISFFREWIEGKMNLPKFCDSGPDADK